MNYLFVCFWIFETRLDAHQDLPPRKPAPLSCKVSFRASHSSLAAKRSVVSSFSWLVLLIWTVKLAFAAWQHFWWNPCQVAPSKISLDHQGQHRRIPLRPLLMQQHNVAWLSSFELLQDIGAVRRILQRTDLQWLRCLRSSFARADRITATPFLQDLFRSCNHLRRIQQEAAALDPRAKQTTIDRSSTYSQTGTNHFFRVLICPSSHETCQKLLEIMSTTTECCEPPPHHHHHHHHPPTHPPTHPTTQPPNHPTNQPTNKQTNKQTKQTNNQTTKQPNNQPINQQTNQPTKQPTNQPRQTTNQPTNKQTNKQDKQPNNQTKHKQHKQPNNQTTNNHLIPMIHMILCHLVWFVAAPQKNLQVCDRKTPPDLHTEAMDLLLQKCQMFQPATSDLNGHNEWSPSDPRIRWLHGKGTIWGLKLSCWEVDLTLYHYNWIWRDPRGSVRIGVWTPTIISWGSAFRGSKHRSSQCMTGGFWMSRVKWHLLPFLNDPLQVETIDWHLVQCCSNQLAIRLGTSSSFPGVYIYTYSMNHEHT